MSFIRKVLLVAALMALPFGAAAADDSASKIVGGTQSSPGAWPFQVALVSSSVSDNFQAQFCGGTLIKPGFVLTAAHCITDDFGSVVGASSLQVLVGTQSLSSGGKRISVTKIFRHPSYNTDTLDFDVAVLKLATNVTGITPITLISPSQESTLAAVGDLATVVGWGNVLVTEPGSDAQGSFPTNLREVKVPILSRTRCNSANSYQGAVTQRMFCAGTFSGGKDSCQGDSGGPLIVANTSGKFNVQAGVVSWGFGCAFRNLPGIYTRLAHPTLNNWVRSKIGG